MKPETARRLRTAVDAFRANGSREFRDLSLLADALALFAEDLLAPEGGGMARATLEASIDYMTDVATSQHAHDDPIGRHYHAVVAAAQAHLATLPKSPGWSVTGIDAVDPRTFIELKTALEVAGRALEQGCASITVTREE